MFKIVNQYSIRVHISNSNDLYYEYLTNLIRLAAGTKGEKKQRSRLEYRGGGYVIGWQELKKARWNFGGVEDGEGVRYEGMKVCT